MLLLLMPNQADINETAEHPYDIVSYCISDRKPAENMYGHKEGA
jgi:hypothetical protein